jgi:hypothetical protein
MRTSLSILCIALPVVLAGCAVYPAQPFMPGNSPQQGYQAPQQPPSVVVNNNITMPPPAIINNNSQPNNNNAIPQYSAPQAVVPQQYSAPVQTQSAYSATPPSYDDQPWAQPEDPTPQMAYVPPAPPVPPVMDGPPAAPLPYPVEAPRYYAPQARPHYHAQAAYAPRGGQFRSENDKGDVGTSVVAKPDAITPVPSAQTVASSPAPSSPLVDLPQHPEQTPGVTWGPTTVTPVDEAGNPVGPSRIIPPAAPVASTATHKEWAISEDPNAPGPVQVDVPN